MPNPKAGTVTMDVTKAINDIKAGKIEYRLDKTNIIHVPVGKASFTEEQLADNFQTLMDAILKAKPSTVKGAYLKSVSSDLYYGPRLKAERSKAFQLIWSPEYRITAGSAVLRVRCFYISGEMSPARSFIYPGKWPCRLPKKCRKISAQKLQKSVDISRQICYLNTSVECPKTAGTI